MDVLMGGAVVLAGAVAVAVACMAIWGTIRALGDGKWLTAATLVASMAVAAYYGKQGYAAAADRLAASSLHVDLRSGERVIASEWPGDLKRLNGRRAVTILTPDARELRVAAQTVELRKRGDEITSIWVCSDRLISDDAADLANGLAGVLGLRAEGLDAWADRRRHAVERDPPGWSLESGRHPYVKLTIDADGAGFWWVGLMYAK